MGLYDSIMVPCPKCEYRNEFQTKSGPCELNTYQIEDAPDDAMLDVNRHAPIKCHVCDTMYSAPERPTQLDILSANPTACREDIAKYRALVAEVEAERDEARACAALEAQHHAFLRKERDEARSRLAEVERERDEANAEWQGADGKAAAMEAERDVYRSMLCDVIASAHPHRTEHPRMFAQWERARELLKDGPPVGQAWAERDSALSELAQVKARLEAFAPVDDLIDDCAWSQMDRHDLRDDDLATFVVTAMQEAERRLEALSTSQPAKEMK